MPQAPTIAVPARLPLVVQPENRDETPDKDAKLVNGYIETNAQTKESFIYKRPGLDQHFATIAGTGRGVYNWQGDIYRIQGATIYKNDVAIGGGAPNGALNTAGGVYRFSSCLGTPQLQFGNGAASYNYDGGAGPITTIAGANFSGTIVKGWAYLDGTTYVMNTAAEIKGCTALNTPTVWTDILNTITAQIEPDAGVALGKQLVYVVAFKQWTTEIFFDQLNTTGSPLGPVQGAKINYGCINSDSIQEIDGAIFWLATNRSAAVQIILMDNLKATIVSTKPIERLLGEADLTAVASFSIKYEGHRFYGLTLKNDNITLVYDLAENMWAQWTDANGNYFPIVSATFNTTTARVILQHESNGKLYHMDSAFYNDDGSVITVDIYTPNFDAGVRRRKQMNVLEFIADQTAGSTIQVRTNDYDYDSKRWTPFRKVDLSVKKPTLTGCGSFMRRAHHLRHQANTPLRIMAVEMQLDIGTL